MLAVAIFVFTQYAPLAYGGKWTQDECKKVKLFETWDWDCNTFHTSYDQYTLEQPSVDSSIPSSPAPVAQDPKSDAHVTPQADKQPPAAPIVPAGAKEDGRIIHREEKVEYRDEHGRILNEEQVAELKGKVSFQVSPNLHFPSYTALTRHLQTRYETRTRIVDADGVIQYEGPVEGGGEGYAPPHPDVEGRNPETGHAPAQDEASKQPPVVEAGSAKDEKSIAEEEKKAKPASEGNEATGSSKE